jgi:biotin-dependent carboxylase-like uncharacterized protein
MTSIQDMGRHGLAYYAIPASGVMDPLSALAALRMLGMRDTCPLIECTAIPPTLQFHDSVTIALTGADFQWHVHEKRVRRNELIHIQAGDILSGQPGRKQLRGYIGIRGDWQLPPVFGSYATYTAARMGGFKGRLLRAGDRLHWSTTHIQSKPRAAHYLEYAAVHSIPIHPGPEFHWLGEQGVDRLCTVDWVIGPDTNRMGARLLGSPVIKHMDQLPFSAPVLPGFIQLLPNGMPVVILQDGQTTGGYARVAYIKEKDLPVFSQVGIGQSVQFHWSRQDGKE